MTSPREEFFAGAREELAHVRKNPIVLALLLAITVVYPIFVSNLYRADQVYERPFAVVDLDDSSFSRRLTLMLDATQGLSLAARVDDTQAAQRLLIERKVDLIIELPAGLSGRIKRGQGGKVAVWNYSANLLTYGAAYPAVSAVIFDTSAELAARRLSQLGLGRAGVNATVSPLRLDARYEFLPNVAYGSFLVPGVLLVVLQQVTLLGLVYSAGLRRENERKTPAFPASPHFLRLWGRAVALLPAFLLAALGLLGAFAIFDWPAKSLASLAVLFAAFVVALLPLGMFFSCFVEDRYSAFFSLMFLSAPLLMISGYAMPTSQFPLWLRGVASVFPSTPALQALQVLTQKSPNLADVKHQLVHITLLIGGWSVAVLVVRIAQRNLASAVAIRNSDA